MLEIANMMDPFKIHLIFGEFLGLPLKNDEKWKAVLKKLWRIFIFCCMITPFSAGCHYIFNNFKDVANVTNTLAPVSSLGFCILRYFRFMQKREMLGDLLMNLRKSTNEGLWSNFKRSLRFS